jgi:hypothetical protein
MSRMKKRERRRKKGIGARPEKEHGYKREMRRGEREKNEEKRKKGRSSGQGPQLIRWRRYPQRNLYFSLLSA